MNEPSGRALSPAIADGDGDVVPPRKAGIDEAAYTAPVTPRGRRTVATVVSV